MLRCVAVFLAAVVAASGCSRGGEKVVTINRVEQVPVELSVTVKGDVNVAYRDKVNSQFIVRRFDAKSADERNSQVVGTEPVEPIKLGTTAFLAGVSIVPYEGDGEYTIPVGSPLDAIHLSSAGGRPEVGSSVKVDWWPGGDVDADPETFMRRVKPCKVVVKDHGTRGTVECPDVTNDMQDKHVSLSLTWVAPARAAATTSTSGQLTP